MSARYFPHAILFIGVFFFLTKGIFIFAEQRVRIPFTTSRYLEGPSARWVAVFFFLMAIICAWDFIYLLNTPF
jgi:hypothetical protein